MGGAETFLILFFLLGWWPCGLIGAILFTIGLKKYDNCYKNLGRIGLFSGLLPFIFGILGGLVYVVVGG